jgi:hypothetical protein
VAAALLRAWTRSGVAGPAHLAPDDLPIVVRDATLECVATPVAIGTTAIQMNAVPIAPRVRRIPEILSDIRSVLQPQWGLDRSHLRRDVQREK